VLACGWALATSTAIPARAAEYGRILGVVTDTQGNPLMGAAVTIMGPLSGGLWSAGATAGRVITDAHGRFAVERLLPGWYSLQVTAAMHLPVLRGRVRVEAGETFLEKFVLGDILAPLRLKVPEGRVSNWGENWKWVLRTSAATRPLLRFREGSKKSSGPKLARASLSSSQRLIGMIPGSRRRQALGGDVGIGSVLAYLRPLSEDSDLLVAGSLGTAGMQISSLATVFRRDILKGDPQEVALVVHQLSFGHDLPLAGQAARTSAGSAQGVVVSYAQTRRLFDSAILTAGMEIDYLNAAQNAFLMRPHAKLEYQLGALGVLTARYGGVRADGDGSLLDRVGAATAFPRVTLRGSRPQLEKLTHAELSFARVLPRGGRLELAAYRDHFQNTAVWGFGQPAALGGLVGNLLANPASNGVTLNGGDYISHGLRVSYTQSIGSFLQTAVLYGLGDALAVNPGYETGDGALRNLRSAVVPRRSQAVGGRVTARLPKCRTQITTSYEWLPNGRVTEVDPYGQTSLELQPFLGVQIRQPLPNLAFLPARIEALADFRNLLAQGHVSVSGSGEEKLLLTPAYRSIRGGFAVHF